MAGGLCRRLAGVPDSQLRRGTDALGREGPGEPLHWGSGRLQRASGRGGASTRGSYAKLPGELGKFGPDFSPKMLGKLPRSDGWS